VAPADETAAPRPRIVVCGLGPAGPDLVTAAALDAAARIPHRYLRTTRHPAAVAVGEAHSFDHLYQAAEDIEDVYRGIVSALVDAARAHGEVLYAVPGSPAVAERTVELLIARGGAVDGADVAVDVVPALSFADLAWVRLGIDPLAQGVRLVDGHRFDAEAAGERGPLLVAQCDTRDVLSDVKLAVGDALDAGAGTATVTVLQRLGLPDESVRELPWDELDRSVEPDHLTSVWVPQLAAPVAGEVAAFAAVVRRLRAVAGPGSGPGDAFDLLEEALGDLLFQVVFHATLAAEEGRFTLADVARGISDKLIGRHPHVFGSAGPATSEELAATWEQLKKAEKGRESVMDGIPATLPALLYALKVQKRAASEGVDWRTLVEPDDPPAGLQLMELAAQVGATGADPETELRLAAERVRDRFRRVPRTR
jgi:tetrapyrrole methylase family protein/MazG family protein